MMKNLILNNWLTKISTLIVAFAIWYLVKSSSSTDSQYSFPIPGEKLPEKGSLPILQTPPDGTSDILTSPIPGADTTTPAPPAP
ncbi:hypothetical protein OAL00_03525 [Verrucomicrobiales bacterium]|jgi:hypothetical protein|nr:hypothetical protein [Verrucomicrobiales bacterium]